MSLELWNTIATTGTFLVIAATAVAAVVQLRHVRSSNQIAVLNELRATYDTPAYAEARQYMLVDLPKALADPTFRYHLAKNDRRTSEAQADIARIELIGNSFEVMGLLVKTGLIDRGLVLEIWSGLVTTAWERLAPATAIVRRRGGAGVWENFEYLAVIAEDWLAATPSGTYPPGMRRLQLKDEWLEADERNEPTTVS